MKAIQKKLKQIDEIKDKTNFINYERKLQDKSFLLAE